MPVHISVALIQDPQWADTWCTSHPLLFSYPTATPKAAMIASACCHLSPASDGLKLQANLMGKELNKVFKPDSSSFFPSLSFSSWYESLVRCLMCWWQYLSSLFSPESHLIVQAGLELASVSWDHRHMLSHHVLFLEGIDITRHLFALPVLHSGIRLSSHSCCGDSAVWGMGVTIIYGVLALC